MMNRFFGSTLFTPRPTGHEDQYAGFTDQQIARIQSDWDNANASDMRLNTVALESIGRQAEAEAARRQAQLEHESDERNTREAAMLEDAWQSYEAAGGTREQFEQDRETILADARRRIATDAAVSRASEKGASDAAIQRQNAAKYRR